jgi:hypothetical protein
MPGDYRTMAEIIFPSGIIGHRDITDITTDVTVHKSESRDRRIIKHNRIIGPIAHTLDTWIKQGMAEDEAYRRLGKELARQSQISMFGWGSPAWLPPCHWSRP